MGRPRKGYKYQGCNEDCFNCPYPDCYKPAQGMKPIYHKDGIGRAREKKVTTTKFITRRLYESDY
jgi:hypothetical protein